jgi:dipeptidase E
MAEDNRRIVAMGGGGFAPAPANWLLAEFVLSLARVSRPRVCYLPTASGDPAANIANVYRALTPLDCVPTDLTLFERKVDDLESFVLSQDVIYVGGGSTANLLAIWRVHGLDRILRRAWDEGVVLCGVSAGMNCWFEGSVTDSFNVAKLAALPDGLGFLSGSCCPHYDGEALRRPAYEGYVATGELPDGWAVDDGAALVFAGEEFHEAVSFQPNAGARRVEKTATGVVERPVVARYLG